MENQATLGSCGWFLEETDKTEKLLNHMRNTLGTFQTERSTTYSWFEGYLAGVRSMYRKTEENPIPRGGASRE